MVVEEVDRHLVIVVFGGDLEVVRAMAFLFHVTVAKPMHHLVHVFGRWQPFFRDGEEQAAEQMHVEPAEQLLGVLVGLLLLWDRLPN
jgi:hypothetical protein